MNTPKNIREVEECIESEQCSELITFETPNMSLAAYLLMNDLELVKASRVRRRDQRGPEFHFVFMDPEKKADKLSLEFISSESRKFDDCIRQIRSLTNTRRR